VQVAVVTECGEVFGKLAAEIAVGAMMDLEPRLFAGGEAQPAAVTGGAKFGQAGGTGLPGSAADVASVSRRTGVEGTGEDAGMALSVMERRQS
jgi:hypothetical protein